MGNGYASDLLDRVGDPRSPVTKPDVPHARPDATRRDRRRIAVIGGGASGALVAVALLDRARASDELLEVTVFEPRSTLGTGVAYSTSDLRHTLNSPAQAMSGDARDPDSFENWLNALDLSGSRRRFPPRAYFGRYLGELLVERARAAAPHASLAHERVRVVAVDGPDLRGRMTLTTEAGERHDADTVVLALGNCAPSSDWAPSGLHGSPRFIDDPWEAGALDRARDLIAEHDTALLVGTGLTMADVAVSLSGSGAAMIAISRSGLVPRAQLARPTPAIPTASLEPSPDISTLSRAVLAHIASTRRATGDWRPGIDSLRPITGQLWQRLELTDKRAFVTRYSRLWEVHRHRLSPETAARLARLLDERRLEVCRAEVNGASRHSEDGRLTVSLSNGRRIGAALVVNCTGPREEICRAGNPLLDQLLRTGRARPGPLGIGLDTRADGRLLDRDGRVASPTWVVGPARKGTLWESTAIPEIRTQAALTADAVLGESRRVTRTC